MYTQPFVHLFQTSNGFYLYDVNTDSILDIEKDTYQYLFDIKYEKNNLKKPEEVILLESKGYLKTNKLRKTEHPATELLTYHSKNRIEGIILQVTQNCNLRCSYCTYSGGYVNRKHNNKRMSQKTAKEGIDFLIKHSRDCDELSIGFYGGEPLLEFDLIKYCVDYVKETVEDRIVRFNLTTNGTLLNRDIIDFFKKNNISIMVSLDGPSEIHDKNRRFADNNNGSFDIIMDNLNMVQTLYPEYFKESVHYNTVLASDNFSCINKFIAKSELFQHSLFLSSLVNEANAKSKNKNKKSYKFYEENAYAIFIGYLTLLGKINQEYNSKLLQTSINNMGDTREGKQGKQRLELPDKWHHGGPCVPGVMRLFINTDGNFYPCEKVSESDDSVLIGNLNQGFFIEKMNNLLNIEKINQKRCLECWAYQNCRICVASFSTNPSQDELDQECLKIRRSVESDFKDYCVLKDLGYDFEIKDFLK